MKKMAMLSVAFTLLAAPALAEDTHKDCEGRMKVEGMGMVNEETLRQHIEATQARLDAIRRSQPRSSQHRKLMQEHLDDMRQTWIDMHDMMLEHGCQHAAHGATVETRLDVIERQMGVMQQMMDQLLGHMMESERE